LPKAHRRTNGDRVHEGMLKLLILGGDLSAGLDTITLGRPLVLSQTDSRSGEVVPVIWHPATRFASWGLKGQCKGDFAALRLCIADGGHQADKVACLARSIAWG
jgi:hypothetical protein